MKDSISKELVSREFNYTSLQSLIEAAQRFEEHKDPIIQDKPVSNGTPDVLFFGHGPSRPTPLNGPVKSNPKGHFRGKLPSNSASGKSSGKGPFSCSPKDNSFSFKSSNDDRSSSSSERPICLAFNRFRKAYCELPNNRCQFNRLHNVKPVVVRVANHAIIY